MFLGKSGFGNEPHIWRCDTQSKVSSMRVSNGIYDEIKIDETLDIANSINKDDWTMNTAFDAKFHNNLEAGNLDGGGLPIQYIRFKRRKVGDLNWETMVDIPFDKDIENYDINDYYIKNAINYEYALCPVIQSIEGVYVTNTIMSEYFSLFLTGRNAFGILKNYPLRFDLQLSDIAINEDKTFIKTLSSQFPAVLCGESKYYTGTVTCDLISPTTEENAGKINMSAENIYREEFEDFIHLNKPMLIRNHSMYLLGILSDIKKNPFSNDCAFGIWTYNFNFTQVNNANNLEILKSNLLTYEVSTS